MKLLTFAILALLAAGGLFAFTQTDDKRGAWTPASDVDGAWTLDALALAHKNHGPAIIGWNRKSGQPLYAIGGGGGMAARTAVAPAAPAQQRGAQAAPRVVVPFVRAAHEHVEGAFIDTTFTPGASLTQLGPFDVPAYGFVRSIYLVITCSGGSAGSGVLAADAPWNVINDILVSDVNGAEIFHLPGYELMLANMFGGYAWASNPFLAPDVSSTGVVTFTFGLRIPVEVTAWDGYGSLSNLNAAQPFRVRITGETSAAVWSTAPTTVPVVRVQGYLEAWSNPAPTDLLGNPQEQKPPAHGTSQFWSRNVRTINVGSNTVPFTRVGNLIRTLILVERTSGARVTADLPDPINILWDARQLLTESRQYRRQLMYERYGIPAANFPAGVLVYDFAHDRTGHAGNEDRHLYLPTVQATRLELQGTFASAGTLTIITNDIAPERGR